MDFQVSIVNGKSTVTDESGNSLNPDNVVIVNDPSGGGAVLWLAFFNATATFHAGPPAAASGTTNTPTPTPTPSSTPASFPVIS